MAEPTLRELLNRLRWDVGATPSAAQLTVLSRLAGEVAYEEVAFSEVTDVLPAGLVLAGGTFLPYHRVVRVRVDGATVWQAVERSGHGKP